MKCVKLKLLPRNRQNEKLTFLGFVSHERLKLLRIYFRHWSPSVNFCYDDVLQRNIYVDDSNGFDLNGEICSRRIFIFNCMPLVEFHNTIDNFRVKDLERDGVKLAFIYQNVKEVSS